MHNVFKLPTETIQIGCICDQRFLGRVTGTGREFGWLPATLELWLESRSELRFTNNSETGSNPIQNLV